jgi:tetratricopeptide (TPR) repeat protein
MSTRLEQLLEMLKAEPQDAFLRYAVALEYEVAGNLSEAIARIEALINDQPDYLGAYYKLGQLHEQQREIEKALDVYHRGAAIAKQQNNTKTLGEINTAILLLED